LVGYATIGFWKFDDDGNKKVRWYCHFDSLDLSGYTGAQIITPNFSGYDFNSVKVPATRYHSIKNLNPSSPQAYLYSGVSLENPGGFLQYRHWSIVHTKWYNHLLSDNITNIAGDFVEITVNRIIDNEIYASIVKIYDEQGNVYLPGSSVGYDNIYF